MLQTKAFLANKKSRQLGATDFTHLICTIYGKV